jgi:glycosyltransferase involved in cell wall biosynthesis
MEERSISGPGVQNANSSPRVLLVVEQLRRRVPGGIGTYARGLIQGFADRATGPRPSPRITLLASRLPRRGLRPNVSDPLERFGLETAISRLPGPVLTRAWDLGLVRAPATYNTVHSVSLAVPPRRQNQGACHAASVVAIHDLAWRQFPETATKHGRGWHEAALRCALRTADGFVVPSQATAKVLEEAGARPNKINVIPYGSDHLPRAEVERTEALLHRLGIGGEFLLSVGTVEPRKNLGRLVAAYAAARSRLPEKWPLLVVGPTGWSSGSSSIDPAGVYRLGEVEDGVLTGLYAKARLFAYVPLMEGFGFPPLEAMRMGTPVVTSHDVPSVVEAPEAEAALMVDPFDVESIAAGLVAAATDDDRRARVVDQGTSLVRRRTWEKTASDHAELWTSFQ